MRDAFKEYWTNMGLHVYFLYMLYLLATRGSISSGTYLESSSKTSAKLRAF